MSSSVVYSPLLGKDCALLLLVYSSSCTIYRGSISSDQCDGEHFYSLLNRYRSMTVSLNSRIQLRRTLWWWEFGLDKIRTRLSRSFFFLDIWIILNNFRWIIWDLAVVYRGDTIGFSGTLFLQTTANLALFYTFWGKTAHVQRGTPGLHF